MKILAAQLNPTIGDLEGNTDKIINAIEAAKGQGADIVVCPELSICGYAPEDLILHERFIDAMELQLHRVIDASEGICVLVGLVRRNPTLEEKQHLNSAAVIYNKHLLGFHDKWLLPTYDVFNERRYFARGKTVQVWNIKGVRIGVLICEDMWQHAGWEVARTSYPWDPVKEYIPYKPDILFNLTASPYQSEKRAIRVQVCQAAARTLKCPIVYVCQVGANAPVVFDGYSLYVDEEGRLCQAAEGFKEDLMLIDTEKACKPIDLETDPMEDLYSALKLGLTDYFHKAQQERAILGLSGGLDSALVAAIAADALGKENLLAIHMPTRYSSDASYDDAKLLSERLGIEFLNIPIDDTYEHFINLLTAYSPIEEGDITLENLQARIRAVILMAFANKQQRLLLGTSNKSELALGYYTLYGDMCGAICTIGDVAKTQCYVLAQWINRNGEIIPNRILVREPSAELRHHQKDTDSLPPYGIVDKVLKGYVEGYLPLEVIAEQNGIDIDVVRSIVIRIYRAEHKRRQSPPSIRITQKSFAAGRSKPLHFNGSERVY